MRRIAILALAASLALSGCASLHSTAEGVLSGGLIGAGVGAAAVAVAGGSVATGAAIGGVVGAGVGGYLGHRNEKKAPSN
ncbi:MAG: hypothetical protein WAW96_21110 [Alphaproteobacteria bacterium]